MAMSITLKLLLIRNINLLDGPFVASLSEELSLLTGSQLSNDVASRFA
jgi:hypothetical protein